MSRPSTNSWKNYGGTYKHDNLQNVTLGTLVADNIILRQDYASEFVVQGNIVVMGDASFSGNAYYSGNTFTKELFCRSDTYINGNLYVGTNVIQKNTNYAYIHGNIANIGINTIDPLSVLDIVGQNGVDNVLTVRSITNRNYNIISENINNNGVIAYTEDIGKTSSSNIQFYNKSNIKNVSLPDGKIGYLWDSSLLNGFLDLSAQNIRIDASNTLVSSSTSISRRSINQVSYFDETLSVYDTNNKPYLYNIYNDNSIRTGNALSLIAIDNSSSTVLNIVAPNKLGLSIGGGAFVDDTSRSLGYIGMNTLDSNNNPIFNQTQTIVSGTSKTYYKSTVGINTYSPKTEKYVLDINGPTRIGNGEMNIMTTTNFEITSMNFSKTNPNFGIACGWPTTISPPYNIYTITTNDGGVTWSNPFQITLNVQIEKPTNIIVYVLDEHYSIIGSTNNNISALYITNNGGHTWTLISSSKYTNSNYNSLFLLKNDQSNLRIFSSGTYNTTFDENNTETYISYFDISISQINQGNAISISEQTITEPLSKIKACDHSNTTACFVGNGIAIYDITTSEPKFVSNTFNNQYNNVYVYDSNYIVAVGSNIISINTNARSHGSWRDITISDNLNSVYLYDLKNGIAIGDSGSVYYTIDGSTWNIISDSILNSSGIKTLLTNPNHKLTNVFMPNINSFIISNTIKSHSSTSVGESKIIYGFFPNLFNHGNNKVLDVSGNMFISGDINIEDRLFVQRDVSLNGRLYVSHVINSENFDSLTNNIYIGPSDNSGQTIFIGTRQYSTFDTSGKTIYIGNQKDTVILRGEVINEVQHNFVINSKNIILNESLDASGKQVFIDPSSSEHSGILFSDRGNNQAGYFLISNNKDGFLLQPTSNNPNSVKMDINSMVLDSTNNINTGLIVLKKTEPGNDSAYTMTLQNIDTSNILIRNKRKSTDSNQVIDSTLSVTDLIIGDPIQNNGSLAVYGGIYQFPVQ